MVVAVEVSRNTWKKYKKDITSVRENGIRIGGEKGKVERNYEIVNAIIEITGLSKEEIEKLNNN